MKTSTSLRFITMLLAVAMLQFTACRKKEPEPEPEPEPDTEQTTTQDNNTAEMFANDIESMGSQVGENGQLTYRSSGSQAIELEMSPCATVTPGSGTRTFTVDFGTSGCTGYDGRVRTGKLIFDYSGSTPTTSVYYRNPGFKLSVSAVNYVVDGHSVTINNKTITNTTPSSIPPGVNPGTNLTWSVTANISIQKPNNGGTITWICNRTKELVNTNDTTCYRGQGLHIIWSKAIVKLNGTSSGTNAQNESYSVVATNLVRDFNCAPSLLHPKRHPFISGTIFYTPGSRPVRLIDYGSGACDQVATLTVSGHTFTIVIL
jgi:hypothetical protein